MNGSPSVSTIKPRRSRVYVPGLKLPFNVSRSKIALFLECPRCFWIDRRLGISRPDMPPFNLNNTVDYLLKTEFDQLREQKKPHSLMVANQVRAYPFWHPDLYVWRDDPRKVGAVALHQETNLNVHGMIDDIWIGENSSLHIVDYKATSTEYPISLNSRWKEGYKRQMEVYQWIFRRLGFNISPVGYFLFANATKKRPGFYGRLEFDLSLIPYEGQTDWIEPTLQGIKVCLESNEIPAASPQCEYCSWREQIAKTGLVRQSTLI